MSNNYRHDVSLAVAPRRFVHGWGLRTWTSSPNAPPALRHDARIQNTSVPYSRTVTNSQFSEAVIFFTAFLVCKGPAFADLFYTWALTILRRFSDDDRNSLLEQKHQGMLGSANQAELRRTHELCSPEEDHGRSNTFYTNGYKPWPKQGNKYSMSPLLFDVTRSDSSWVRSGVILIFKSVPTLVMMTWQCFWLQQW